MIVTPLLCLIVGAYGAKLDLAKPPIWPPSYSVKGVLSIPHAEIDEPFQAWFLPEHLESSTRIIIENGKTYRPVPEFNVNSKLMFDSVYGVSRIDYYDGTVKSYQYTPKAHQPFGIYQKIVPMTTEEVLNQDHCMEMPGSLDNAVELQSVFPDMTDFRCTGATTEDKQTLIWEMNTTEDLSTTKYTMWVKYEKFHGFVVPIPVRFEVRRYHSLLKSCSDHFYIIYKDYSVGSIDPDVFIDNRSCAQSDSPAVSFNPMMGFVYTPTVYTDHIDQEFDRFKDMHGKIYDNEVEHERRKHIFLQNLRFVNSHNRANRSFSLAINHLADRTDEELSYLRGRLYREDSVYGQPFPYSQESIDELSATLPSDFDLRKFGAVKPVQDQSLCGSCWAFAAVGAVEGALFMRTQNFVSYSEQALIDCSWGFQNQGCDGGLASWSYSWTMKHGLPTEKDYGEYLAQDGKCHINNVNATTKITGWTSVVNNENALRLALFEHGPVSVAIDASHRSFIFYSRGVYYEPKCENTLDKLGHAVLAVGFGILRGEKYWLIKNSWSDRWGNDGYVLMSARNNHCGVQTNAEYVVV